MAETRDVLILGGGHNGLVTAFHLAKAGYNPLVIERRPQVGGAAITDELHPGFRCSTLAHAAGPLRAEVLRDMNLEQHGLKMIRPDIGVTDIGHHRRTSSRIPLLHPSPRCRPAPCRSPARHESGTTRPEDDPPGHRRNRYRPSPTNFIPDSAAPP